ncbi:head maturation protease, ClpP-related [Streptomyces sp. NPDC003877]
MPFIDLPDGPLPGIHARAPREERPWYRFKNVASDEAELFLYDEIGGWGTLAEDFIAELKAVTSPKLRVRVSSPGGSVFEGVAVANALRAHSAEVTVQVDSIAASIASVIAMAGDRVVMQPQAMLMVHDASGLCMGNAQDMADMAALLDKISGNIADAYVAKAGGDRDDWRQVMKAETWFTAEEAIAAGLADEVLPQRGKPETAEDEPTMRQFDLTAYGYTGPGGDEPKAEATLTEDIRSLIGEEIATQLAAAVAPPVEAAPIAEPVAETTPVEPAPAPAAEPEPEAPAAEPEDEWAADTAALLTDPADDWAADLIHLIGPDASSSAATAA